MEAFVASAKRQLLSVRPEDVQREVVNWFTDFNATKAFAIVGGIVVGKFALSILSFFWLQCFRPSFLSGLGKYGARKGAWAVVTGASDGIGKAFASQLAKKGFNLLIISRTESRLNEVKADIEKKYKVQVKVLAADLCNPDNSLWENRVQPEIEKLGITCLVNNAGTNYEHHMFLHEVPRDTISNVVNLNVFAATEMTRRCLPIIRKSNFKGLIVNVGSGSATVGAPLLASYAGSKAYLRTMTEALAAEYKGEVDCVYIKPYYVVSAMSKIKRASLTVPQPAAVAAGTLNKLGYAIEFNPYWAHALMDGVTGSVPKFLLDWHVLGLHKKLRGLALKRKARLASESATAPMLASAAP
eukprot:tig00000821_g4468.t1